MQIKKVLGAHRLNIRMSSSLCRTRSKSALERKKHLTPPIPKKFDGCREAQLIDLACHKQLDGSARCALRLLADELVELGVVESISHEIVHRVIKKTNSNRTCGYAG